MAWTKGNWKKATPLYGVNVPGSGPKPAYAMLFGDRPGKTEPSSGLIFSGAVGHELNRYLKLAGLSRDEVYLTNLVKDYNDEAPTEEEIANGQYEFLTELEECGPVLLVPMGRTAIRYLLGDVDVEQVHGIAFDGAEYGYPGITIYPTYHPAAGLHSGDNVPTIHHDFAGLGNIESRRRPADVLLPPDYRTRKGTDLLQPEVWLAIDSEGRGFTGEAWSAQFSQKEGTGRIVYAHQTDQFRPDWNRFWSAGGRLLVHGSMHDLSVFRELGLPIRRDQFVDTIICAYNLTDVPQGLKALAYRIAGMEMQSYEEVVAPARRRLQEEWLEAARAVAEDITAPELELVWDDKKSAFRVKQPQTVAQRLKRMTGDLEKEAAGGKAVDIAKRVDAWEDSAAVELREVCGELPFPTLDDIPRAEAEQYACRDADATLRIGPHLIGRIEEEGLGEVNRIDHAILPMVERMQRNGFLVDADHFRRLDEQWTQEMSDVRDKIESTVGVRINPSSPDQVSALLFKQLGLPSRKLTKGGDDSTQDKVLEGLRSLHPVLPLIMDYRELDKMRGSFCRKMIKLQQPDGRVRGNIRVTRTASGRMSMTNPNLFAIPVRMARGRQVREGFVAADGNVIYNADLDQIEMREIADASGDELLHELFSDPDRDIHTETAGRMFDKELADVDPKTERYAAKRVGFGIATQITGAGLVDQMELAGARHADNSKWTADECDHLIELWFGVYPGVRRFIDRTKAALRRTGFIRDRWGRIRHLEGIWSTIDRIRAEAERQAPSHVIQSGAQGLMKQCMAAIDRRLEDEGLYDAGVMPLLQIYDSLMFEVPEYLVQIVDDIVQDGLSNTVRYSVPITASSEWGYSWGKMDLGED